MEIIFHSLDVEAGRRLAAGHSAAIELRPVDRQADAAALATLVAACRAWVVADEASFTPSGIAAELVSRPGRRVDAWLAWTEAVPAEAVGLVAVVEASDRPPRRFSIAWLLVHPQARRRGIATALVAHALDQARSRGAATVAAETRGTWRSAAAFWRAIAAR